MGNILHVQLGIALSGFYSKAEVLNAKKKLFEVYDKVMPGDNGHCLITRKGDSKNKADIEDIVSFTLDKLNCVLPKLLAEDPDKLPRIKLGKEDIVNFFTSISDIKESLSSFHKITSELRAQVDQSLHVSKTALSDKVPNVSQTVTNYASAIKLLPMAEQNNLPKENKQKQGQKIQQVLDEWQEVKKKRKNNRKEILYMEIKLKMNRA